MSDEKTFSLDQRAYRLLPDEVARSLNSNFEGGLSKQEARRRHNVVGDNALEGDNGSVSIWKVLLRQAANALTLVLSDVPLPDYRFSLWQWHCLMEQLTTLKEELSPLSSFVYPSHDIL